MKRSKDNQLELNFDGENNNYSKEDCEKKPEKNVDYSFDNRLSQKKQVSEHNIYKEIIMLAKHI